MTIWGTTSASLPNCAASESPYKISVAGLLTPIAASAVAFAFSALTAACHTRVATALTGHSVSSFLTLTL